MSGLVQWRRWKTEDGIQEGIMRGDGEGVLTLGKGASTPVTLASVLEHCQAVGVSIKDWAEDQLTEMPARHAMLSEEVVCPVDLEMLFGCQAITDNPEAAPALYLKASRMTLAGPRQALGLRPDIAWHVVHPALIAVFGPHGDVVGFSLGLDVTASEILMRHPLYIQEAQWFAYSAAIGPALALSSSREIENVPLHFQVRRRGQVLLGCSCIPAGVSRRIEMAQQAMAWVPRAGWFGLMLPVNVSLPDVFQLEDGDEVSIAASGLGELTAEARWLQPSTTQEAREPRLLQIHPDDTVAVALDSIKAGSSVSVAGMRMVVLANIPFGHKVAIREMKADDWVIKYGEKIGVANRSINRGEYVHTHNLESSRGRGDLLMKAREGK